MNRETSEQLVRRQNDKIGGRKTKAAAQGALDKIHTDKGLGRNDLAKTLDFPFSLKINGDGGAFIAPLLQTCDELRPFRLGQHEIADSEFANVAIDKGSGKIFAPDILILSAELFDPAFTNPNMRRHGHRRSFALGFRLELDHPSLRSDVIADTSARIIRRAKQHSRSFACAH